MRLFQSRGDGGNFRSGKVLGCRTDSSLSFYIPLAYIHYTVRCQGTALAARMMADGQFRHESGTLRASSVAGEMGHK